MSYVSRYQNDVFLSYAHEDDATWIGAFEKSLRQELNERLGYPVALWQDVTKLRIGQSWTEDIRKAIASSALFVAILSPNYRTSEWCKRERGIFRKQFDSTEAMKVSTNYGSVYRFLKIIKIPWDDDQHLGFFKEAQHYDLFVRDFEGEFVSLSPGTDDFRARLRHVSQSIAKTLRAMRRQAERVFVATPTDDALDAAEALRDELLDQGYDVEPDGPVDEFFDDAVIMKMMEPAVLSVHLMGAVPDGMCKRQLDVAWKLEKRLVLWFKPPEVSDQHREAQITSILNTETQGPPPTILNGNPRRMIQNVLQLLVPNTASVPVGGERDGARSVYLMCDASWPEDWEFAKALAAELNETKGTAVVLPEIGLDTNQNGRAHQSKLDECDGILLYHNTAPQAWLEQNVADVEVADRMRRKPFQAKAFVVKDTSGLGDRKDIVPLTKTFSLNDLEPFLADLRGGKATDASP